MAGVIVQACRAAKLIEHDHAPCDSFGLRKVVEVLEEDRVTGVFYYVEGGERAATWWALNPIHNEFILLFFGRRLRHLLSRSKPRQLLLFFFVCSQVLKRHVLVPPY